jgi:hypothetical protein
MEKIDSISSPETDDFWKDVDNKDISYRDFTPSKSAVHGMLAAKDKSDEGNTLQVKKLSSWIERMRVLLVNALKVSTQKKQYTIKN